MLGRERVLVALHGEAPDRVPILLGRSESRQVADRVANIDPLVAVFVEMDVPQAVRVGDVHLFVLLF